MERLAGKIANYLTDELNFDNDKRDVIAYGFFAILHTILSVFLVIVFGLIFNVVVEALIISFTTSILRRYSGGVHASTPGNCTAIGTVLCIGQTLIVRFALWPILNVNLLILLGAAAFLWCFYIINKLAPIDNPSKPIVKEEKRKRMKKLSFVILMSYLAIVCVNIAVYFFTASHKVTIYCLSIYAGMLWQTFTLTKTGHKIFKGLDIFLSNILIFSERVLGNEKDK